MRPAILDARFRGGAILRPLSVAPALGGVRMRLASIAATAIDRILQRLAALVGLDLPDDGGCDGVRHRDPRVVRADVDGRVGPQARIGGERLALEHVERSALEHAGIERGEDVGFDLQAPATGVDEDRASSRPPCLSPAISEASMSPRVASVSGRRTTSISVFPSRRFKPSAPEKHSTPGSDFSLALQPATLKPSAFSFVAASHPMTPRPSTPT